MHGNPTVYVVGDDPQDRKSLQRLSESAPLAFEHFPSAREFLDRYEPNRSGCVVVFDAAAGSDGLQLQQRLIELGYDVPVIIVSAGSDLAMAVRAMKAGAVSVLQKPVVSDVMLNTIREAMARDSDARKARARSLQLRRRLETLTPREREVLALLVRGKANKEVAACLSVSEKTIEIHRAHVMKKLRASNVASLVRLVFLAGDPALVDPADDPS
jgi:FixJ family two-component response regulator